MGQDKGKKPKRLFSDNVVLSNLNFGGAAKRKKSRLVPKTVRGSDVQRVIDEAENRKLRLRGLKL